MSAPCDWDGESYCVVEGCKIEATHRQFSGVVAGDPVYEMVCCSHALNEPAYGSPGSS